MILCPYFTPKGSWKQAETFFSVPMLGLDLHSSLHAQIACGNASEMVIMVAWVAAVLWDELCSPRSRGVQLQAQQRSMTAIIQTA